MKLLLVEDDPSMQVTLQRALARSRIDVRICGDGALAVEQWRALEPDVVALDLSLPNLDGLQVLAQARAAGCARRCCCSRPAARSATASWA